MEALYGSERPGLGRFAARRGGETWQIAAVQSNHPMFIIG
jgi:hypothetical protein